MRVIVSAQLALSDLSALLAKIDSIFICICFHPISYEQYTRKEAVSYRAQ